MDLDDSVLVVVDSVLVDSVVVVDAVLVDFVLVVEAVLVVDSVLVVDCVLVDAVLVVVDSVLEGSGLDVVVDEAVDVDADRVDDVV